MNKSVQRPGIGQYLSDSGKGPLKQGVESLQESQEKQITRDLIESDIETEFPDKREKLRLISNAGSGDGAFKLEESLGTLYPRMECMSIEYLASAITATNPRLNSIIKKLGNRFSITHANNEELADAHTQDTLKLVNGIDILWNDGMCTFNSAVERQLAAIINAHERYQCFDKCWGRGHSPLIYLTVALKDQCRAKRLNKLAENLAENAGIAKKPHESDYSVANLAIGIWLYFNHMTKWHGIKFMLSSIVLYRSTQKLKGTPMLLIGMKAAQQEFSSIDMHAAIPEVQNLIYNQQLRLLKEAWKKAKQASLLRKHFTTDHKYLNAVGTKIIDSIQVQTDPSTGVVIANTNHRKTFKPRKGMIVSQQIIKHRPLEGGIPVQEITGIH